MKRSNYLFGNLALTIFALTILRLPATHSASQGTPTVAKPQVVKAYGQLPLTFEANQGQTDERVKFLSHGSGYSLFLAGDEAVLALKKPRGNTARDRQPKPAVQSADPPAVVRMRLVGANAAAKVMGLAELPGKSNYFIGNDREKWRTNVPNYAEVKYTGVYRGVDLVYYGNQGQLEYDFVVQPGADPQQIALQLVPPGSSRDGAKAKTSALRIDKNGDLIVATADGEVIFRKPVVYQPAAENGQSTKEEKQRTKDKHFVSGSYELKDDRLTFEVASYDKAKPLVIDPTLVYSTYLGGSGFDGGSGIAVDASGNAYITGGTDSSDFPATSGAFQTIFGGGFSNAFVSKLNPAGSALLYSTYLGGSGQDNGQAIAVDASGNAYVTGAANSSDFPTTPGAFQTTAPGNGNVFIAKLNAMGSALLYSTYLGGSLFQLSNGLAVDASGNAYVTGFTFSPNFPTTPGAFETGFGGDDEAFVTKLNAAGSALVYSTYLGGNGGSSANGIAVDAAGNAYVVGAAGPCPPVICNPFPITQGAFQTTFGGGGSDAFVTRFNSAGSALVYSTYLGGSGHEGGFAVAVDASRNAYVTGFTDSPDFPVTQGAFQTTYAGNGDAFISKLNGTGSALAYSTYLGGTGGDATFNGSGVAVDPLGSVYVTSATTSTDFPTTRGAFQTTFGGGLSDAFVTKLNAAGSALAYSTYLGGSGEDVGTDIAIDASANAYVIGFTFSPNFPTSPGVFQTTSGGGEDAFVSKFSFGKAATTCTLDSSSSLFHKGEKIAFHAQVDVVPPGEGTPTGKVRFVDSGFSLKVIGTEPLTNGAASITVVLDPRPVVQYVKAVYTGDKFFSGCESEELAENSEKP